MESTKTGWWNRHGWTIAILLAAFGMAFAIRTIWTYPIIQQFGPLFSYAGGSDSYYHSRVTTYIILNHQNLIYDPLLHYPVGGYNPREPLFDWMNAILGLVFAPAFGGNAVVAGAWFLDLQAPLWAALGVFPVYLIGREVSGKRMGLIAALIFPFLSANIDSSIFGYANYLSFYTFLILVTIYAYIRTVKAVGSRRWIDDYRKPRQYLPGLRGFLRTERTAVKWAVFTGVSLGALALAWQGYTYAVAVIGVSVFIAVLVERVRRVDSFGLYVATWIVGLVGFPMAIPYYLVQHQFATWFDLPLLLYFGVLALLLPFMLMRDVPWIFSIPSLILLVVAAAAFLAVFEPTYFTNIVTGQGYFAKTLIYSTVAEAQAPSIDELVVGYGVITFFLAFVGLGLFIWALARGRFKRHHIIFVVFAILSIYLPISAAKFFLLGSPAFALLPAEAIQKALDVGSYGELRRTVASLSDRRSQAAAFRKAFKPRHVLIMLLVLVIIIPNVWVSIDAGIPGNTKTQASDQVYDSLPSFLKGNSSTSGNYFGAAGTTIDTWNQYDSAGYNWLAEQDTALPESQRPAVVSWWDYGFQTIDQGEHPSVADNFQNGIDPAGQFLLAQNESSAIAVLATTLLAAEQTKTGEPYLPPALNTILAGDGLNLSLLHNYMTNLSADVALVVAHPDRYLPVNPSTLTGTNAMYMAVSYLIATSQTLNGVAKIYDDVQSYTGWSVRYDLADSRLIPFSGEDTGIYYAPADLTGRIVNAEGIPVSYYNVTVLGSDGNYYPLGSVPADVSAVDYYINYFSPFYNSMIYRTYFGYNGTDIGLSGGIPGLEGAAASDPVEPGWMLQHFEVVYKTAYYCNNATQANSNPSACYVAMNTPEALKLASGGTGVANTSAGMYFSGGESMLEYYAGQTVYGDVTLADGTPVGGARVTVFDQFGIPHMSVTTAPDGSFSLILPPGNDTVNVTTGTFQGLSQQGNILLKEVNITVPNAVGLSFNAPSIQLPITIGSGSVHGFVYYNIANNSAFVTPDPTLAGAKVILWGSGNLSKITATTDASGAFSLTNVPPGIYNYNVIFAGYNYTETALTVSTTAPTNGTVGLTVGTVHGTVFTSSGTPANGAVVTFGSANGFSTSNETNATGNYTLSGYAPGNYTLTATLPGTSERSVGVRVVVATPGYGLDKNLTLATTSPVSVTLVANGAPAVGVPVQFTPIASFSNGTISPIASLQTAVANGTTGITGANGAVTVSLPVGNYSVSALGYVGSTLYAGVGELVASTLNPYASIGISLAPAIRLTGSVSTASSELNGTRAAVIAYSSAGSPVYTWTTNGSYSFYLPAGTYSVLALEGSNTSATGKFYSALGSVALSYPTSLNLNPTTSIVARFFVGSVLSGNVLVPAAGARVTVSAGSAGASVTAIASGAGDAALFVPATLPLSASSYCLSVSSVGFSSLSECVTPSGLQAMSRVALSLTPVPVTINAPGVPSGTSISLNLTAKSTTGSNATLTGGPTWTLSLAPGTYSLYGWAPTGSGSVLYLPTARVTFTVPFGATSASATIRFASQVNSTGILSLPSGAVTSGVTVSLESAAYNVTMNGTAFTKYFYAPPGTYSAHATVQSGSTQYAYLGTVSISSAGLVRPGLSLTGLGYDLSGSLETTSGAVVPLATTASLTSASGTVASVTVTNGTFSATLPGGQSYAVSASATTLVVGADSQYLVSWVAAPGSTCTVADSSSSCTVTMVSTTQLVWLNGTLTSPGVPGNISGTVRLYGPSTDPVTIVVPATNGTFSARVLPGSYSIYATGGGGSSPLAGFVSAVASLGTTTPVSITLSPTWAVSITVVPPTGSAPLLATSNVTVTNAFGYVARYTNVSSSSPLLVALPVGTYTVAAASYGLPGGLLATAGASATVKVVSGNVGTTLALAYEYVYRATASIVGSSSATVTSPGTTSFAFTVKNAGNIPLAIHPVGSPSYWTFNFSFANATLAAGPGAAALSGSVVIYVPSGTATVHPDVVISFELSNGTVVGSISPTVNVVAYYGISVGSTTSSPPQVGVAHVLVPFYLANTGNIPEEVHLSVVDTDRLSALGWTVGFRSVSGGLPNPTVSIGAFTNTTYSVNLTAVSTIFVAPGYVTVQASVLNLSGAYQSTATIVVPFGTFTTGTTNGTAPVTVTGPSVGVVPSTLPVWVVPLVSFVPAIALVVAVITYRWWRSRRWTRR